MYPFACVRANVLASVHACLVKERSHARWAQVKIAGLVEDEPEGSSLQCVEEFDERGMHRELVLPITGGKEAFTC